MVLSRTLLCCVLKLHVLCRIFVQQKCCNFGEISDETFDEICVFFMNASRFKPALCCNFRVAICVAILLQLCRPSFLCFCCFSLSSETFLRFRLKQSPRRPARRETLCVVRFFCHFLTRFRAFFWSLYPLPAAWCLVWVFCADRSDYLDFSSELTTFNGPCCVPWLDIYHLLDFLHCPPRMIVHSWCRVGRHVIPTFTG